MSPYRDEDAKCLVVQMLSNGHVMMQVLMWVCHDVNAPLWVCRDANVHVMQTQFIHKFFLFSKRGFHNAWNQNIFKLNLLFLKSHLPFDLRLPRKFVITVRKSPNGAFTWKSNDLDQKTYSRNLVEQRDGAFPRPFFGKMNYLKIKHFKKIHFCCSWIWQFDKRQDPPW